MPHRHSARRRSFAGACLFGLLTACGGGGGGGGGSGSSASAAGEPPEAPVVSLEAATLRSLELSWTGGAGATAFRLLENPDGASGFTLIGEIPGDADSAGVSLNALWSRREARYILEACNDAGCSASDEVAVDDALLSGAIGYLKARHPDEQDRLGSTVAVSGDGTLVVAAAPGEDGDGGSEDDDSLEGAGALYLFPANPVNTFWGEYAYLKAANADAGDRLGGTVDGVALAVDHDGDRIVAGADLEDGDGSDPADNSAESSGAAYVFEATAEGVVQHYLKAANADANDRFGWSVAINADGDIVAVGAPWEDGDGSDPANNGLANSGAVYVFERNAEGEWAQTAYLKAANAGEEDWFGNAVALSGDGRTLAVGAWYEDGDGSDPANDDVLSAGAVYVFVRDENGAWTQQAYLKSPAPAEADQFGVAVALDEDGDTLAVGAWGEDGDLDADPATPAVEDSGAVHVFVRDGGGGWSHEARLYAGNADPFDVFGKSVSLTGDGALLAVGAIWENGDGDGFGADPSDNTADNAGAVYLFRKEAGQWLQIEYLKAPNSGANDEFGRSVGLARNGTALAVGAQGEASAGAGPNGEMPEDDGAPSAGAVYVY